MFDIKEEHLKIILAILNKYAPNCEVSIFGSRFKGTAKEFSDLDIALVGKEKLGWSLLEDKRSFSGIGIALLSGCFGLEFNNSGIQKSH